MNKDLIEVENNLIAIVNSIVDSNASDDKELRMLKRQDFLDKFKNFKETFHKDNNNTEKEKFDIAIFTIVPIEFEYANKIFQFMGEADIADIKISGLGYHKFVINRATQRKSNLSCVITLVGTAGDVNCALTCSKFFNNHDCDLAILCGIAAGVEEKIKIYSPIIAQNVTNYEYQRLDENGITYRPKSSNLPEERKNEITEIIKKKETLNKLLKENIRKYNIDELKLGEDKINAIDFKTGVIAAGAKLLADTKTIQTLREKIPIEGGIMAVEMEGSGFVPACEMYKKNWMVFRGISDYGQDDKSNPNNKQFQKFAVISAITTMKYYLENHFDIEGNKVF